MHFYNLKPRLSSLYPREGNIKFVYLDKPTFIWQSNTTSWVEAGSRGLGEENIAGFSRAGEESNRAIYLLRSGITGMVAGYPTADPSPKETELTQNLPLIEATVVGFENYD